MKKTITVVLLTTMVIIILIWAVGLRFPTHIYSPDDLHKDHQGIQDCRQCHIPFKGAASGLCMTSDCHTIDRLSQLSNKLLSDLHISYARQDCLHCHTEHKGIAGKITKPFDHKTIDVRDRKSVV